MKRTISLTHVVVVVLALGIVTAAGLLVFTWSSGTSPGEGADGSPTPVTSDDLSTVQSIATEELALLPTPDVGVGLVAAIRGDTSTVRSPDGLSVTWKLAYPREAGSELWVASLHDGRWWGTGDRAIVGEGGSTATGIVRHLSVVGLLTKQPPRMEADRAQAAAETTGDDEKRYARLGNWTVQVETALVRLDKRRRVQKIYMDWPGVKNTRLPREVFLRMLRVGDYETIKALVRGNKIAKVHAHDMADLRLEMVLESADRVVKQFRADGIEIRVTRSDTGNVLSGIVSDVDQTFYVDRFDAETGKWVRDPTLDWKFNRLLATDFAGQSRLADAPGWRLTLADVDVQSVAGRDRFPDWRTVNVDLSGDIDQSLIKKALAAKLALRWTQGAYSRVGAIIQQMDVRAWNAINDLPEDRVRLGVEDPVERSRGRKRHPALSLPRLADLVAIEIGAERPGHPIRRRPLTRRDAKRVVLDSLPPRLLPGHAFDAAVEYLMWHSAEEGNALSRAKLPLRAFDNGPAILLALDEHNRGTPYMDLGDEDRARVLKDVFDRHLGDVFRPAEQDVKLERYRMALDIAAKLRGLHLGGTVKPAEVDAAFKDLAEKIAKRKARFEGMKKRPERRMTRSEAQAMGAELPEWRPQDTLALQVDDQSRVSHDTGVHKLPAAEPLPWKDLVPEAKKEYARICRDFLIHNVIATSVGRIREWSLVNLLPDRTAEFDRIVDMDRVRVEVADSGRHPELRVGEEVGGRRVTTESADAYWKKIAPTIREQYCSLAGIELFCNLRDLDDATIEAIRRHAERKGLDPETLKSFDRTLAWAKSWKTSAYVLWTLRGDLAAMAVETLKGFGHRVYEGAVDRILQDVGIRDVPRRDFMGEWFIENKRRWVRDSFLGKGSKRWAEFSKWAHEGKLHGPLLRFGRNAILDPGNVTGVINVMAVWQETGDIDEVWDTMKREGVYAIPLVGQVVLFWESGWGGRALIVVCVAKPVLGIPLIVFGVSQGAYRYYKAAYVRPLGSNVADGVYRGWVGPTLREFRVPGPLETHEERLLTEARAGIDHALTGPRMRQVLEEVVRQLEARKRAFSAFKLATSYSEGVPRVSLLGVPNLLEQVPYRVLHTPQGTVNFDLLKETEEGTAWERRDKKRKEAARLRRALENPSHEDHPTHDGERVQMQAELAILEREVEGIRLATDYRKRAKDVLELALRIRIDSLYPWALEDPTFKARHFQVEKDWLKASMDPNEILAETARQYVTTWLEETLPNGLTRSKAFAGILQGIPNISIGDDLPEAAVEATKQRFAEDIVQSRRDWIMSQAIKKGDNPQASANRIKNALVGSALEVKFDQDSGKLVQLASAIGTRHVPAVAPSGSVRVRAIEQQEDPAEWSYESDVRLCVDPSIYKPPYAANTIPLLEKQVESCVLTGMYEGIPLGYATRTALRDQLLAWRKIDEKARPPLHTSVLTLVTCGDVNIPRRVVPETVEHLLRPPLVKDPSTGKDAYLLAALTTCPTYKPLAETEGDAPRISTRRCVGRDGPFTLVEVTAPKAFELLDEGKDESGLLWTVEVGPTRDGPWKVCRPALVRMLASDPIKSELKPDDVWGVARVGEDRVWLDVEPSKVVEEAGWPHRPLFFRVGQQWSVLDGDEWREKDVIWSQPADQGEATILWHSSDIDADTLRIKATDDWIGPSASMVLKSQAHSFQGTRWELTAGPWKGFWFTSARDGKTSYGGGGSRGMNWERMSAPVHPELSELKVVARAQNIQAAATLRVALDGLAEWKKAAEAAVQAARKTRDDDIEAQGTRRVAYLERELASARKELRRRPKELNSYNQAKRWFYLDDEVAKLEYAIKECKGFWVPNAKVGYERQVAGIKRDWNAAVIACKKLIEIEKQEVQRRIDERKARWEIRRALLSLPGAPEGARASEAEGHASSIADLERRLMTIVLVRNLATDLRHVGYLAADINAVRTATSLLIRAHSQPPAGKPRPAGSIRNEKAADALFTYANYTATLTGECDKAARLYREAVEMSGRRWDRSKITSLPAWWPR